MAVPFTRTTVPPRDEADPDFCPAPRSSPASSLRPSAVCFPSLPLHSSLPHPRLQTSCVAFPELANTSALLATAVGYLSTLLDGGVYPDGVETEQASGYDMGTAGDFFGTLSLLADAGLPRPDAAFVSRVEAMWAYGALISDPVGCLPRNGDSDLCGNGYDPAVTAYFGRGDWTYVHTNGAQGTLPPSYAQSGPSTVFPWAGQVAMRSGYDVNATWLFFDIGPYGSSGHGHRDALHVNLHSRGSMLLVDSGRFSYSGDDLSAALHEAYSHNTSAHNTLTIDGCDQLPLPPVAAAPIANGTVVFARDVDTAFGSMAHYNGLAGSATHTRGVFFQRSAAQAASADGLAGGDGDFAVVVDVITSDRPRAVTATWHAHPNSSIVQIQPGTGVAVVGGVDHASGQPTSAQVCVVPARASSGNTPGWANASIVRGVQADPATGVEWQGWYSQTYDDAWPASVLIYDGTAPAAGKSGAGAVFAWLLVPSSARNSCDGLDVAVMAATATDVKVLVTVPGQAPFAVSVPLN